MQTVHQIASEIVAREGGYVNDPDDPGGATNFGVTIGTMRRLGLDLTGDGLVSVADVRKLTRAQAIDIFITHYFERPQIAALPSSVQSSVFDMYVNAGSNAVRILQRLLGRMGQEVSVDGVIGPQTIAAAQAAAQKAPDHFGGTITSVWPMRALPAGNTPVPAPVVKAVGSNGPRNSSRPSTTSAQRNSKKGRQNGDD
jgi:lysozyme family protein